MRRSLLTHDDVNPLERIPDVLRDLAFVHRNLPIESVTFSAQVTCFLLLNYSVRGLLLGNAYIDERERELRDRATAVAYRILAGALAFIALYVVVPLMFKLGLPMPSTAWHLLLLLIPLGWLATSLPQSVLAWTLPDHEP